MKNKTSFLLSLVMAMSLLPAQAHYEHPGENHDHKSEHQSHSKVSTKQSTNKQSEAKTESAFSPWKLLEMALTPAYAYVTKVSITIRGNYRIIKANGLPDHATGSFPNRGNPNRISEQKYEFKVPKQPRYSGRLTRLGMYPFGVAINGIPFDPNAAEWWQRNPRSGWTYEAMVMGPRLGIDQSNAHVQPNGAYHYHGIPLGLMKKFRQLNKPALIGYAADGFPIYGPYGYTDPKDSSSRVVKLKSSYRVKRGTRKGGPGGRYTGLFVEDYEYVKENGDLDEANGRFGFTPEYPDGTYYYVVTDAFPFIPRMFRGTPDSSFMRSGPGGPPGGRGMRGGRRGGRGMGNGFGPPGRRPPPGFGHPPGFGPPPGGRPPY